MYHIAYATPARELVEVFTPSRWNAFRVWADFARAGHKPRLFKVRKQACDLIA
jgi:hypothetical protein